MYSSQIAALRGQRQDVENVRNVLLSLRTKCNESIEELKTLASLATTAIKIEDEVEFRRVLVSLPVPIWSGLGDAINECDNVLNSIDGQIAYYQRLDLAEFQARQQAVAQEKSPASEVSQLTVSSSVSSSRDCSVKNASGLFSKGGIK